MTVVMMLVTPVADMRVLGMRVAGMFVAGMTGVLVGPVASVTAVSVVLVAQASAAVVGRGVGRLVGRHPRRRQEVRGGAAIYPEGVSWASCRLSSGSRPTHPPANAVAAFLDRHGPNMHPSAVREGSAKLALAVRRRLGAGRGSL